MHEEGEIIRREEKKREKWKACDMKAEPSGGMVQPRKDQRDRERLEKGRGIRTKCKNPIIISIISMLT